MSSDWRSGRDLAELRDELAAAGIVTPLVDKTPVLGRDRWREIDAWLHTHAVPLERAVIVDDTYDMGPLAARFIRCSPLTGLDAGAARAIVALFDQGGATAQS